MRHAPFDLPYALSGMYCSGAMSQLQSDGMVEAFPGDLISKIQQGSGLFGSGCQITQHDIDRLSDTAWNYLKDKLG